MSSFFSDPSSWVLVAFIIFVIIALVIKAPSMIAKLLDGEIDKIKSELEKMLIRENRMDLFKSCITLFKLFWFISSTEASIFKFLRKSSMV